MASFDEQLGGYDRSAKIEVSPSLLSIGFNSSAKKLDEMKENSIN